ncbi:hypothetical protein FGE12_00990 [Aggregicoccus sp. 17bor-14]|uniref:hypothetical protein n=1 Tax=Myxococcaceae TaxID=31 RepID=UPI00129CE998|nr:MULTISPECIES: hypothetical protein [Myxococcaceae]MBF5040948.1 hypothetical protein [Simulacricoccus sp. 17bor-14]MRI86736.1 hypothetical protein [Aggregicoccus sp. 17bor-14]
MTAYWLARRQAWMPSALAPRLTFALFALGCLCCATSLGPVPLSLEPILGPLLSAVLLAVAAQFVVRGLREHRRAEALRALAPRDVDEAVGEALRGERGVGVFRGRLGARGTVTSPAGLVCAFYESELRANEEGGSDGGRGALLTQERGHASLVTLRGERHEVAVTFAPSQVIAPLEPRRCRAGVSVASLDPRLPAGPEPVEAAMSWERVGRIGEPCLVVGALVRGAVPGRCALKGLQGGPALLVLGSDGEAAGAQLLRRAWTLLGSAAALVVCAAFVLSRL